MAKRALVLLEGNSRGTGLLYIHAAHRLGLHPITLSADPSQYDYFAAEGIEAVRVDTDNLDALIRECSRLCGSYDVAGITGPPNEALYATIGKLCARFDLPGPNPTAIERCCDKFAQRELLATVGVPIPAYRLAKNAEEVASIAAEIGLPVIVKPAEGSGSSGVRLCRNVDELTEQATYLLTRKHEWRGSPRILVEEFVLGPYYTVDIMGSEIVAIGTGDFGRPPHFVYHQFAYPAPLTDDEHERIADVSLNCMRALGLGWGPANIELRWTKLGPVVIEVNPRLAGTPTPQLVQLAYGVDLISEHIKLVIGEEWDLRRKQSDTAAARFLVADGDGTLDWIDGDSPAAAASGVAEVKLYVKPKTPIVRKGDYRDCIGHVIAASPSLTETEAMLERAIGSIDWSIVPFSALATHAG
ncbi:MAG: ATP-grasp domain-containing protein [Mesorhizobium sp.]|uniref:ATP-grasp domain-containing protein n=1 Tax=Mesorhizobium sp. TaxID=1871066 RepID=UPI0011FD06D1|nr:acetyl-CoA carboxylase biotin carboxylase subunit family protein [Mesorhizobium sp.]TIM99976.1 MAG: ATP-grasp domain-containing protein [Mesorhizobium sp.]